MLVNKTKTSSIDWQKAADDAANWVSEVMSEAHRAVIEWNGPTDTWLAFDTSFDLMDDPEGYLECLCDGLTAYAYEVRASALSKDKDTLAILFTFGSDGEKEVATALMHLWDCWRDETDMVIDGLPKKKQDEQRQLRDLQEAIQRKTAAARVERWLMEQPSDWDEELEQAYRIRQAAR